MKKIQPATNTLDMDFLNQMDKQIGGTSQVESTPAKTIETPSTVNEVTEIDTTISAPDFANVSIDEEEPVSRNVKATQIVVRTTEKEREALKSYFMKHGVSLSKGIKIAIRYLEQQEKRGKIHFSDIGISEIGI